jgi:hypothetical protein
MFYPPTLSDDGQRGFDATDHATDIASNRQMIINLFAEVYFLPSNCMRQVKLRPWNALKVLNCESMPPLTT